MGRKHVSDERKEEEWQKNDDSHMKETMKKNWQEKADRWNVYKKSKKRRNEARLTIIWKRDYNIISKKRKKYKRERKMTFERKENQDENIWREVQNEQETLADEKNMTKG